jgi:MFS family permease
MAALSLGIAAGTFTSGRFVGRTGRARDAALVANATALLGLVAFNFSSSLAAPWLAAPLFLVGFGIGPLQPIQIVLMQLGVPAGRQGAAGGMLQFFRRLGSWAGAGAAGVVLAEYLHREQAGVQGSPWPHLLSAAICAGFLAANLYVVWRMPRELIPE